MRKKEYTMLKMRKKGYRRLFYVKSWIPWQNICMTIYIANFLL